MFLSRISAKKNLLYALVILKEIEIKNIIFDIYGTTEDMQYWEKCKVVMNDIKNVNVKYKGAINPTDIPKMLSQYHLFFLPTKNENFGHAIVEAMQSGVIPLISDQTPWSDLENFEAGFSLNLNNKDAFIQVIKEVYNYDDKQFKIKSNNVKEYIDIKLDNKKLVDRYIKMFKGGF